MTQVGKVGLSLGDTVPVVPASPSQSLLDTVMAETMGMAMHNAVVAQNNMRMVSSAAVTAACARMVHTPIGKPVGTRDK